MQKNAPDLVWGCLNDKFSRKIGGVVKVKSEKLNAVWVNLSLNCPVVYQVPYPYITSSKELFDYKRCVISTLVENNMTNKPMGLEITLKKCHSAK